VTQRLGGVPLSLCAAAAVFGACAGCDAKSAGPETQAPQPQPTTAASAPDATPSAAAEDPSAQVARWAKAREAALHVPCRAIAVDGPVRQETNAAAPDASAPLARPDALAVQGELPGDAWLVLGPDARLVAKDPRTTRETTFVGPARVRACVGHTEESWIGSGRFESAVGAGETPGAEEWVVTPLGVVRYMAAKVAVDVAADTGNAGKGSVSTVSLGSGAAFLWMPGDVHLASRNASKAADAAVAATTFVDDDGWTRMTEGVLGLSAAAGRPKVDAVDAARAGVGECTALSRKAHDLADKILAGPLASDGGAVAKDQVRTRRLARAACAVASLRVDTLPPSAPREEMSAALVGAGARTGASAGTGAVPTP
jgi:hypothetical protein